MVSVSESKNKEGNSIMKEIVINGINGASINFAAEDNTTLAQICEHETVMAFFDEDADTIKENLLEMNGGDVSAFRGSLLTAQPSDGDSLLFDLDGEVEENNSGEDGEDGVVVVATSGGLQTTNVDIVCGRTTVHDAIYCDVVRARSGMTDAQLSNCTILLNEEEISDEVSRTRTLRNGDTITLSARAASSKGKTSKKAGLLKALVKVVCR